MTLATLDLLVASTILYSVDSSHTGPVTIAPALLHGPSETLSLRIRV